MTTEETPTTTPDADSQSSPGSGKRFLLVLATIAGIIWLSALLWMTLEYANPTTLNRRQLLESHVIVSGTWDPTSNDFIVDRAWPDGKLQGRLHLENIDEVVHRPTGQTLVPVSIVRGDYYITPAPLPENPPLVYEFNDAAQSQLNEILGQPSR